MKQLDSIHARDIMQSDVVTLTPSTPLKTAIATFEDLHISGAPVVDVYGRIVGMLSAFDVARPDHFEGDRIGTSNDEYSLAEEDDSEEAGADLASYSMEGFNADAGVRGTVADWMSRDVQVVGPEWPLSRICRLMVKEHIHRVPVVEGKRLVGIITTLDVARCVAGVGARTAKSPARKRTNRKRTA